MKTKNMKSISTLIAVTVAVSILVAFSATASATTYTVCSSGCDFTTIQAAIGAASDGDTINVAAGTYVEYSGTPGAGCAITIPAGVDGLTIQSTGGADTPIIDCGDAATGVQIVASDTITFSGFTVQNAYTLIRVSGNNHNLNNLILTDFVNEGMWVLDAHGCTFSDITIHGNDESQSNNKAVEGIDIQEFGSGGNTNNQFEDITIYDIETTGTWGTSRGIFFEGDNPDTNPTTGNTFTNVDIYNLASEYFNCGVYIFDMGSAYTPVHSFIDPYAIEDTTFSGGSIYGFTENGVDVVSRGFYVKGGNKNLDITGFEVTDCDEGFYFKSFAGTIPPTFPPTDWATINHNSDAYEWEVSDYTSGWVKPHGGSYYAVMDSTSAAGDDYLITPQQSITTPDDDEILFWASSNAFSATVDYDLMVSTTGTDWGDFSVHTSDSVTMGFPGPDNGYTLKTYDLSAYNGKSIYIAIHANEQTPGSDKKLLIDDVILPDGTTEGFEGTTTTIGAVDVTVNCNNIHGNTNYGVDNSNGVGTVDAENNWWGDASGPTHSSNSGGSGDAVSDKVDFIPWSFTPDPCEPKTIGFWKNHEDSVDAVLDEYGQIYLGDDLLCRFTVDDSDDAEPVFNNAKNKNANTMLAAQLLAAELNVLHLAHLSIAYCPCVNDVIIDADEFLSNHGYNNGPPFDPGDAPRGAAKQEANGCKDDLDEYNQGECTCP